MDLERLAEKIRDIVLGEIRDEFREFRASVTGELSGFRIALESINARQANLENELRDIRRSIDEINKRIDETNKRIDNVRDYLLARIDEINKRIDETNNRIDNVKYYLLARIDEINKRIDEINKRIDILYLEVSEMRGDLKKAISDKEIIHDMIFRIERLESKPESKIIA